MREETQAPFLPLSCKAPTRPIYSYLVWTFCRSNKALSKFSRFIPLQGGETHAPNAPHLSRAFHIALALSPEAIGRKMDRRKGKTQEDLLKKN